MIRYRSNRWPLARDPLSRPRPEDREPPAVQLEPLNAARRRLLRPGARCSCGELACDVKLVTGAWEAMCGRCQRARR